MRALTARWTWLVLVVPAALTACGADESADPADRPDEPVVVEITFEDGAVEPNGERIDVSTGQPIDLEVTADEPGEIHIHSDPEQEVPYDAGTSTIKLQIDKPGVVAVESHDLDQVIVQLEVR